jgi:epsilon-lactone hydrolase
MPSEQHERMVADVLPRFAPQPGDTMEVIRRRWDDEAAKLAPVDPNIRSAPVQAGSVAAAWVTCPDCASSRTVLYVHGGGYVQGSIGSHVGMAGRVANAINGRVLLFEYRLAPEHTFPAALDDTCSVYEWLLNQHIPSRNIILMGESAGGGLALATLLRLKNESRPAPGATVCFSPLADFEASGDSAKPGAVDDPMIPAAAIAGAGATYAPGRSRDPLVSPVYGDFSGSPPMLLFAGTREVLLDDSVRLHRDARSVGVDVKRVVGEGLTHAWPYFGPRLPETEEALREVRTFVEGRPA